MWAHQFTVMLTCTNANVTVAIDVLVVVYNKTWENRVMLISSWSASAGYSASILTENAKVDSSSTHQLLPSSVNISAEYPALPDHDSMNNPSICHLQFHVAVMYICFQLCCVTFLLQLTSLWLTVKPTTRMKLAAASRLGMLWCTIVGLASLRWKALNMT